LSFSTSVTLPVLPEVAELAGLFFLWSNRGAPPAFNGRIPTF